MRNTVSTVSNTVTRAVSTASTAVRNTVSSVATTVRTTATTVATAVSSAASRASRAVTDFVDDARTTIGNGVNRLTTAVSNAASSVATTVRNTASQIASAVSSTASRVATGTPTPPVDPTGTPTPPGTQATATAPLFDEDEPPPPDGDLDGNGEVSWLEGLVQTILKPSTGYGALTDRNLLEWMRNAPRDMPNLVIPIPIIRGTGWDDLFGKSLTEVFDGTAITRTVGRTIGDVGAAPLLVRRLCADHRTESGWEPSGGRDLE